MRRGEERRGEARRGEERRGEERRGEERRGEERRGKERRGEERRGESLLLNNVLTIFTCTVKHWFTSRSKANGVLCLHSEIIDCVWFQTTNE